MSGTVSSFPQLTDRYELEEGVVFLTGVQAIVRFLLDKQRRDLRERKKPLRTFISGYEGSPLGGLDLEIRRNLPLLNASGGFVHQPAVNEKVAAAAVHGSQFNGDVDGFWYGKAHGVKWALDELSLANMAGSGTQSGVVIFGGDDHMAKSSGYPASSEFSFRDARIPVFYPSTVAEAITHAHHALALSRYSGLVCGVKMVTPICDGAETVTLASGEPGIVLPDFRVNGRPYAKTFQPVVIATSSIPYEEEIAGIRLDIARAYARLNGINTIINPQAPGPVGLIATGKSAPDTLLALRDMGLETGVRALKLGMIYPLDADIVREFARDLETVIVLEEKGPFVEEPVAHALMGSSVLRVLGKRDMDGKPFIPAHGELNPDLLFTLLGPMLSEHFSLPGVNRRLKQLEEAAQREIDAFPRRSAHYCPGCPHSISARAPSGVIAGGEIGCSSLDAYIKADGRGVRYIPTMGMGGALYNGIFPFNGNEHFFQNIGDGTVLHSGLITLFSSISHGANITYKILWNHVVAMTGGQDITGQPSLDDFVAILLHLGVSDVAVVSKYPERITLNSSRQALKPGQSLRLEPRDRIGAVQDELALKTGVNVLLYDQECATEARRRRKRQKSVTETFVFINEAVCEGCGDCGEQSMCLALYPKETDYGVKTEILQSACNQDVSCLKGDCPSFITVTPSDGAQMRHPKPESLSADDLKDPENRVVPEDDYRIFIIGVGGTGVVTVAHLLGFAAMFEGKKVNELNRTGLAQKGGPVESPVIIHTDRTPLSSHIPAGQCDLYLAADIVGAVNPANLQVAGPERTVAVVSSSAIPTAEMVYRPDKTFGDVSAMEQVINRSSRSEKNLFIDAQRYAVELFGNHIYANIFHLGVAYQAGYIPLQASSLEQAIRLNGQAVETNLQAFRWGRMALVDMDRLNRQVTAEPATCEQTLHEKLSGMSASQARAYRVMLSETPVEEETLKTVFARALGDLIAYQDERYASRYAAVIRRVFEADRAVGGADSHYRLTGTVARMLYKLMAYKDEYEVVRLLTGPEEEKIRARFEGKVALSYHLHPPFLRTRGLKRKITLGPWFRPFLRALTRMKALRGGLFDPFGKTAARREERELIGWYEGVLEEALTLLGPSSYPDIVELLDAPDGIRGYEEVKRRSVARVRRRVDGMLERLRRRENSSERIVDYAKQ